MENDRYVFASSGAVSISAAEGVLANDTGNIEKVELQINPASSSSLSLANDGSFTYTPGASIASDSFSYLVTFKDGSTTTGNVSIKLVRGVMSCTELNVLSADTASLNSTATAADNLTFTLTEAPVKGTLSDINPQTGAAVYTFDSGVRGADRVTYSVTDLYGGSSEVTFRVALTPTRIMPLGDSITEGVESNTEKEIGDPDLDTPAMNVRVGYRQELFGLLTDDGISFDLVGSQTDAGFDAIPAFDFDHQGHPGYSDAEISGTPDPDSSNTDEFVEATDGVYNWLTRNPADIILLHAGTNNVGFRTSNVHIERILDEIKRWESDNNRTSSLSVLVAEIIDKQSSTVESDNVKIFNSNIRTLIAGRGEDTRFLNSVDMFTEVPDTLLDPLDKTHLTPEGYIAMAEAWYDSLSENQMLYSCQ